MKLLLIFCCAISFSAMAQTFGNNQPRVMKQMDLLNELRQIKMFNDSLTGSFHVTSVYRNQGNVAHLPQDHMPCVKPDTKDIAAIPNAWKNIEVPYRPKLTPIPILHCLLIIFSGN